MHDNFVKTSIALFVAETLYKSVKEEEQNPALFSFIENSLQLLDLKQEGVANFHLLFLLSLTRHLGFYPQLNSAGGNRYFDLKDGTFRAAPPPHPLFLEEQDSALIAELMNFSFENMQDLQLNGQTRSRLVDHLLHYYELHLPSMQQVRSHEVLETVLS